jgi:Ca2+-transporting ATPase
MEYYGKEADAVLNLLATSPKGLRDEEAQRRLQEYGPNSLVEHQRINPWMIFFRQFRNLVVYILLGATLLSFIVREYLDAYVILSILFFNAILGFFQEYKAERAVELLRKLTTLKTKVIRHGQTLFIPSAELVPGDIVVLEAGDKVNADMRVLQANNLQTDEAALTGESLPCSKVVPALKGTVDLAERKNMLFSGTSVVRGTGMAVVVATGMKTELGKIALMVQSVEEGETPLQQKLGQVGKFLGYLVMGICAVVFVIGLWRTLPLVETLLTATSLAVAAIPEGLPAVVTICLALSVQRMIKRNALVKKLKSIETLGSITVICSDKTGTLTKNEMTVKKMYVNQKVYEVTGDGYNKEGVFLREGKKTDADSFLVLLDIAASCNNATEETGDPTERALLFASLKGGVTKRARQGEIPFDSDTKFMATTHGEVMYYKGAPEVILEMCDSIHVDGKTRRILDKDRTMIEQINKQMADEALRVLAMAYKKKNQMFFVGLMGMIDPPKEGVKEALELCEQAGIRALMITGDHPLTAAAIARQVGLKGEVMTGKELDELDDDHLREYVRTRSIFARTTSEHKVRILSALQRNGEIVAMTGDGVNDAPAVKKADVGVAMSQKGTDVTRDTADMVLVDDNFSSIVAAIEQGRVVYDNIKKFVNYLLSANAAEVGVILVAMLAGLPLPLLPLQILWVNLMTDSWPALALGVDKAEGDVMKRAPRSPRESIFKSLSGSFIFTGVMGTVVILGMFEWAEDLFNIDTARTVALTTMILFELFRAYSCKNTQPFGALFNNFWLNVAALVSLGLHLVLLYTPLSVAFHVVPLGFDLWWKIILISSSGFFVLEFWKILTVKKERREMAF